MAEERFPELVEKPAPGQPTGLLGIPPAAPPDAEPAGGLRDPRPGGPRTVSLRLSHLFAIVIALSFVSGFALHAAFFPGLSQVPTPPSPDASPPSPSGGGRVQVAGGLGDAYIEGNRNAKVQLIEFSDYQCPFCRAHYTRTAPALLSDYVQTGKVLYAYRDYPLYNVSLGLTLHPGAVTYAMAARCAGEEGKYKEMHDEIFNEQNKQGQQTVFFDNYVAIAEQWARNISLDPAKFNACLESQKYVPQVQRDFQDGIAAGVDGTPSFFIGNPQRGYVKVVGAQPVEAFRKVLDSELASS